MYRALKAKPSINSDKLVTFILYPYVTLVGRLRKKMCTLGYKHETWYNYSLRDANKN